MILAHASGAQHLALIVTGLIAILVYVGLWSRRPTRSIAPVVCWNAGVAVLLCSTLPVMERLADQRFVAHMVQHLAMWVIAPPLLVLARPGRVFGRAGVVSHRWTVARAVRRHPWLRMVLAWSAVVATMYGTHLSAIYDVALRHPWVHDTEHLVYIGVSLLLWSTVLATGTASAPARIALAAATTFPLAFLGGILSSADRPLYSSYVERLGSSTAMSDQRAGAALMWIGSALAMAPLAISAVWRWAAAEERRTLRAEAAEAARLDRRSPAASSQFGDLYANAHAGLRSGRPADQS